MSREMVNSGIPWIGKIPKGWKVSRLKNLATDKDSLIIDGDWIESNVIEASGIRYLTTGNVGDGVFKEQGQGYISQETFNTLNCTMVYAGDLVFSRLNYPMGRSCIIPETYERCVVAVDNVIFRPNKDVSRRYLMYVSMCTGFQNENALIARGATMQRMSRSQLVRVFVPIPDMNVQQRIASFLDRKCAEIDEMIALQEKIVEELKAYKQSVITEAVTKGLNPDVPMKDSGIEWIGKIPEQWRVCRVKDVLELGKDGIKIGPFGSSLTNKVNGDGECKIYGQWNIVNKDFTAGKNFVSAETYRELDAYKIVAGDILVSMMGTIGKCAIIPNGLQDGIMDSHVIKIRINKSIINPEYFELMYDKDNSTFIFEQLSRMKKGSIMDGLNSSIVKRLYLLLPPIDEQQEIVSYLLQKRSEIESLISIKQRKIDDLKEYKKSIIYEYVTGKKEVIE